MKTFEKAKIFIMERARPLERALFAYHFEEGGAAEVLTELARCQPFADMFGAAIQANLDYLIQTQVDDGSWPPPWSWGSFHADTWVQARQEWAGILTLHNLRVLRNFGRL